MKNLGGFLELQLHDEKQLKSSWTQTGSSMNQESENARRYVIHLLMQHKALFLSPEM